MSLGFNPLVPYLWNQGDIPVVDDPYWNDVEILLKLDLETNAKGLPFYRDYSKYQRRVRKQLGDIPEATPAIVVAGDDNFVSNGLTSGTNIQSYLSLPNSPYFDLRLAELNASEALTTRFTSSLKVQQKGAPVVDLGTDEFTLEISFYLDEVNLPWYWQTICSTGYGYISTASPSVSDVLDGTFWRSVGTEGSGFTLAAYKEQLVLAVPLSTTGPYTSTQGFIPFEVSLEPKTWYHVAVVRSGAFLNLYVNGIRVKSVPYLTSFSLTQSSPSTGSSPSAEGWTLGGPTGVKTFGFSQADDYLYNHADLVMSGGISNFRVTRVARYTQDIYSLNLPFHNKAVADKIDANYGSVLYNMPSNYELYDYSPYKAHLDNRELLKQSINPDTGFLILDGTNTYKSGNISQTLDGAAWTIEFYISVVFNDHVNGPDWSIGQINTALNTTNPHTIQSIIEGDWAGWLDYINNGLSGQYQKELDLITILSGDKEALKIGARLIHLWRSGGYFYVKTSEDGNNFVNYPNESNILWRDGPFSYEELPDDELKFYPRTGGFEYAGLDTSNSNHRIPFRHVTAEQSTHVAIQRFNNFLYCLVDGVVVNTVPYNYNIYDNGSDIQVLVGGLFEPITGQYQPRLESAKQPANIKPAIAGVKIHNRAVYDVSGNVVNDVQYEHSLYPLAVGIDALTPPRARIIDIVKEDLSTSVASGEVIWYVFTSEELDNLTLSDFSLTEEDGVNGSSLLSLTQNNALRYTLVADTGEGSGKLTPNFVDSNTVYFKDTNNPIGEFPGELSVTGETYLINKDNPLPIFSSGSNPYVSGDFIVDLRFQGAVTQVDPSKIGVSNGTVYNFKTIDEEQQLYQFTVKPTAPEVVVIQGLEGLGVTAAQIPSALSAKLTKVYQESFPILQLPLNTSDLFNDLSPNRVMLEEIVPNNTEYELTEKPIGTTSVLSVDPLNEQSGFIYNDFNGVGSVVETPEDWTIEFFLRINSTVDSRISHILSIENQNSGLAVMASNGSIKLRRRFDSSSFLLSSLSMADKVPGSFINWSNSSKTTLEKFPHFAITKQGSIYRMYRNGIRQDLLESNELIDITRGDIKVGYVEAAVEHLPYKLSNVRVTIGKALYTSFQFNVPPLPYEVIPNISEVTELLNYISITSDSANQTLAALDTKINLRFSSIIPLDPSPIVTILGRAADVVSLPNNTYQASVQVVEADLDGQVSFNINVPNQGYALERDFSSTTNGTFVVVDQTPLTAVVGSDTVDNGSYSFEAYISFSEPVSVFSLDKMLATNCRLSNLYRVGSLDKYTFTVTGDSTGLISFTLPEDKVQDLAGNNNLSSNTFSRTVTVPTYVPDPYWDNVISLIQPTDVNIVDESQYGHPIVATNVEIVPDGPPGMSNSMYFNGKTSSLDFTLPSNLPDTLDYTVELWMYASSSTLVRLNKPEALPGSDITTSSFQANWEAAEGATAYLLDVSPTSNFTSYLPGYSGLNVGNTTTAIVSSELLDSVPRAIQPRFVGPTSFVGEWSTLNLQGYEIIGYKYEVALDQNFSNKLYGYSGKFTTSNYFRIGDDFDKVDTVPEGEESINESFQFSESNGVILTGLISGASYPKIYYFLEESTVRVYDKEGYTDPIIAEDVEVLSWKHLALVNRGKYMYLYFDGELIDRVKKQSFDVAVTLGYDIGHFTGKITGVRVTRGVARYSGDTLDIPSLPYSKD